MSEYFSVGCDSATGWNYENSLVASSAGTMTRHFWENYQAFWVKKPALVTWLESGSKLVGAPSARPGVQFRRVDWFQRWPHSVYLTEGCWFLQHLPFNRWCVPPSAYPQSSAQSQTSLYSHHCTGTYHWAENSLYLYKKTNIPSLMSVCRLFRLHTFCCRRADDKWAWRTDNNQLPSQHVATQI